MAAYLTSEQPGLTIEFYEKSIRVNNNFLYIRSSPKGHEEQLQKEITAIVQEAYKAGQDAQAAKIKQVLGLR